MNFFFYFDIILPVKFVIHVKLMWVTGVQWKISEKRTNNL